MLVVPLLTLSLAHLMPLLPETTVLTIAEAARNRDPKEPFASLSLQAYEELHRRGARSSKLYLNLGTLYLFNDQLPQAISAYSRGLQLDPTNSTLRKQLQFARERVLYDRKDGFGHPPIENRPPWLPRFRVTQEWLWAPGLGWLCSCLAFTRWKMTGRRFYVLFAIGIFVTVSLLSGLLMVLAYYDHQDQEATHVVIAEDDVLLRKGNSLAYPVVDERPLRPGMEAELLAQRGKWVQIELASGEVGWVLRDYVLMDLP